MSHDCMCVRINIVKLCVCVNFTGFVNTNNRLKQAIKFRGMGVQSSELLPTDLHVPVEL